MSKDIHVMLSEIFNEALMIVSKANHTGEVDRSEIESMFFSMKEVATLDSVDHIHKDLIETYNLCLLTKGMDDIRDTEELSEFSSDHRELPQVIVNSCPQLKGHNEIISGIKSLSSGSMNMLPEDRDSFMNEVVNIMSSYDLMNKEAVIKAFNN